MFLCSQSKRAYSKSKQQMETHILVEKILTSDWSTSALMTSRERQGQISRTTLGPKEGQPLNVRKRRGFSLLLIRPPLNVRHWPKEKTITTPSREPSLKSFVSIFSENALLHWTMSLKTRVLEKVRFMKQYWLEDQQEFQKFSKC